MVSHFTSLDAQRQGERDKASLFASIKDAEHRVRAFDAELVSVDAEAEDARRQQDEKVKVGVGRCLCVCLLEFNVIEFSVLIFCAIEKRAGVTESVFCSRN